MRASGSTVPLSVLKFLMMNSCCTGSASGAAWACASCTPHNAMINAIERTVFSPKIELEWRKHTSPYSLHARFQIALSRRSACLDRGAGMLGRFATADRGTRTAGHPEAGED